MENDDKSPVRKRRRVGMIVSIGVGVGVAIAVAYDAFGTAIAVTKLPVEVPAHSAGHNSGDRS